MHTSENRTTETRVRRKASRLGYRIHRSRGRESIDNFGEFMLVDSARNCVVLGVRYDASMRLRPGWRNRRFCPGRKAGAFSFEIRMRSQALQTEVFDRICQPNPHPRTVFVRLW
jgi:hypothetical protein